MVIFTIQDCEFGWDELVIAARTWGEWMPFVETVGQSLACIRLATASGDLPPAGDLRDAATAFRYAHKLISAEDAKSWLAGRGMSVEDWMSCLCGQYLREHWERKLGAIVAANPVSDVEVIAAARHYAFCTGRFDEWAVKLAGRAAVAAETGLLDLAGHSTESAQVELIRRIEAEFEQQRQRAATSKLIEAKVAGHRLDWIRYDCRYVWFGEERIAREAAWCVTEDGSTLDEVAYDACGVVQRWSFYLDEIEAPARPQFLAVRRGDLLGPIRMMEGFPLFSIVAKEMPAPGDPRIRQRAEREIIAGLTRQAIDQRVKWVMLG